MSRIPANNIQLSSQGRLLALLAVVLTSCFFGDGSQKAEEATPLGVSGLVTPSVAIGTLPGQAGVSSSGAATYRVPIDVPPGRAGIEPSIAVTYSSNGGAGPLGVGFGLSGFSELQRCPLDPLHPDVIHPDAVDLCFGGRLLLTSGSHDEPGAIYRVHGSPGIRIELGEIVDDDSSSPTAGQKIPFYRVSYPNARVARLGATSNAQGEGRYLISSLEDRSGNSMSYEYLKAGAGEILPQTIRYTRSDSTSPFYPAADPGSRRVVFGYDDRPVEDSYTGYRPMAGGAVSVTKRLSNIETFVGADLVSEYRFQYKNWTTSQRSILHAMEKCDGQGVCLPYTSFDWETGAEGYQGAILSNDAIATAPNFKDIAASVSMDVDHDGKMEMLYATESNSSSTAAQWIVWDPETGIDPLPIGAYFVEGSAALAPAVADFNGDGIADLLTPYCTAGQCKNDALAPMQYSYADRIVFVRGAEGDADGIQADAAVFSDSDPSGRMFITHVAEIDGDGYPDVFSCRGEGADRGFWHLLLNREAPPGTGPTRHLVAYPTKRHCYASEPYQVMDSDGDGRAELWVPEKSLGDLKQGTMYNLDPDATSGEAFGVRQYRGLELPHHSKAGDILSISDALEVVSDSDSFDEPHIEWPSSGLLSYSLALDFSQRILQTCWRPNSEEQLPSGLYNQIADVLGASRADAIATLYHHPGSPFTAGGVIPEWLNDESGELFPVPEKPTRIPRNIPFVKAGPSPDRHVDLNGDGLVDILRVVAFDGAGEETVVYNQTSEHSPASCDADASLDYGFRLLINTGSGFVERGTVMLIEDEAPWNAAQFLARVSVVDFNSDGRADLLTPDFGKYADTDDISSWQVYVAELSGDAANPISYAPVALPIVQPWYDGAYEWSQLGEQHLAWLFEELGMSYPSEIDADKIPDLVSRSTTAVHLTDRRLQDIIFFPGADAATEPLGLAKAGYRPDYLVRVTNGLGAMSEWDYATGHDESVYGMREATETAAPVTPTMLVSARRRDTGLGPNTWLRYKYRYLGARRDRRGLGSLGIEVREVEESAADEITAKRVTRTEQDRGGEFDKVLFQYPFVGRPTRSVTETLFEQSSGAERRYVAETRNVWETVSAPYSNFTVALSESVKRDYDLSAGACSSFPCLASTLEGASAIKTLSTRVDAVDELGNVLRKTVASGDGVTTETAREFLNKAGNLDEPYGAGMVTLRATANQTPNGSATRTVSYAFDPLTLRLDSETREPNDASGDLWRRTQRLYDARGRVEWLVTSSDNQTRMTRFGFDDHGYFTTSTVNAVGHETTTAWHEGLGVVQRVIDANGQMVESSIDGFGRPTRSEGYASLGGPSTGESFTYELEAVPAGFEAEAAYRLVTRRNGTTQLIVDSDWLGREKRRIWRVFSDDNQLGDEYQRLTDYDYRLKTARVSVPVRTDIPPAAIAYTLYGYDRVGRQVTITHPDESVESYYRVDRNVTHIDASSDEVRMKYDQLGRVSERREGTMSTCFDYGAFDTLVAARRNCDEFDGEPVRVTAQGFDAWGRRLTLTDGELGNRWQTWDAFDQITDVIDGNGAKISFGYDSLGRQVARTSEDGTAAWTYDTHINGLGKLASSENEDGSVVRRHYYDSFGRADETVTEVDGESYSVSTSYFQNRVSTINYPAMPLLWGGSLPYRVRYQYDLNGYVSHIVDDVSGKTLWELEAMDGWRHVTGERASLNGFVTARSFDPLTGRQNIDQVLDANSMAVVARDYLWTLDGNLEHRGDSIDGTTLTYGYDETDQLRNVIEDGATIETVGYDAYGNIDTKTGLGKYTYKANGRLDEVAGESFAYDGNGNLTSRTTNAATQFDWTAIGKLEAVSGAAGSASFAYDADGIEVRKTVVGGNDVTTVGAGFQRVVPKSGLTEYRYAILLGGKPIAQATRKGFGVTLRYLHTDYRGSVLATSEANGTVEVSDFDAWGVKAPSTSEPFTEESVATGFTGHDAELVAGMIDMKARYYDPVLGRFHSADTIVPNPMRASDWNRYAYVRNNPLRYVDPSGHAPVGDSGESGGTGLGAGSDQYYDPGDRECFLALGSLWCGAGSRWADFADVVFGKGPVGGGMYFDGRSSAGRFGADGGGDEDNQEADEPTEEEARRADIIYLRDHISDECKATQICSETEQKLIEVLSAYGVGVFPVLEITIDTADPIKRSVAATADYIKRSVASDIRLLGKAARTGRTWRAAGQEAVARILEVDRGIDAKLDADNNGSVIDEAAVVVGSTVGAAIFANAPGAAAGFFGSLAGLYLDATVDYVVED